MESGFAVVTASSGGLATVKNYIDEHGKTHLYGVERITTARKTLRQFSDAGFRIIAKEHFRLLPNVSFADRLAWVETVVPSWLLPAFTHFNVVLQKC